MPAQAWRFLACVGVDPAGDNLVQVRLVTESTRPPEGSHAVRRLSLATADGMRLEVRPGSPMDNDSCL